MPVSKKAKTSSSMKRPPIEKGRWAAKGTKPLPDQASVMTVLSVMIIHVCRKVLFIETNVKITLYSTGLFFGSLVCDFLPIPKIYLSQKDNFINLCFVKIGWVWIMLTVGTFMFLTSLTYGCGHMEVVKKQMSRLIVGTTMWFFWTQWFFGYIEKLTGVCLGKAILREKMACINGGFQWHAFDISGHAFILVYMSLFTVEEAKAIVGWEGIRDLIRAEEYKRLEPPSPADEGTPLKSLTVEELWHLKVNYDGWTPYIRVVFLFMTFISLLSDVMLACTVIYYHSMPQKVAGGAIAIATWYMTYRVWFTRESSPGVPGSGGLFKYQHVHDKVKEIVNRRQSSSVMKESKEVPMFMGMPIYGLKKEKEEQKKDEGKDEEEELYSEPKQSSRNGVSVVDNRPSKTRTRKPEKPPVRNTA